MEILERQKPRILIFSTAYLPLIGGAEIAIKEITDRLAGDYDFDLICARIDKKLPAVEKIGAVDVWRVGAGWGKIDKFLLPWRGFKLAKQLYVKQKYDLVWAIMASFGGLAALFFKEQFSGVPYVLTLQEGDTPEHIARRAKWLSAYYQKMFTKADFITAISNYLKNYAIKNGAVCPMELVPNGVSVEKFQLPRDNDQTNHKLQILKLKTKLGIKENEKVIITVSRLVEKNGVGDLIDGFSLLLANGYSLNAKLLIIGGGELEKNLKLKTKNLKLQDKIIFSGEIKPDDLPLYLTISDVFVRPSLAEGLGNAFLEAMAAGVPVIGTRVGGIPDFLRDGETGLFCEVKNPQSIAEKISYIFNDNNFEKVNKIKELARQMVGDRYSWNKVVEQMKKVIEKLTIC